VLRDKQKIVRVLNELLTYAISEDPQKVTITIEEIDDRMQITIEDIGIQLSERECEIAERVLNTPRRNEMRSYYGGLLGEETLYPHNLRIVGMMVDGGRLDACEGETRLSVWWTSD